MHASRQSTATRDAAAAQGLLGVFALVREAIVRHAQVWAYVDGRALHFCPQTLGWRGEEPYVQALVLRERPEGAHEGWAWLVGWQWLRLADLRIPALRDGEWISCPRDQRPRTIFLTSIYCDAA
jgi:hypothetical protein